MNQTADQFDRIEVQSEAELWDWFAANHTQADGIWLVTWKAQTRAKYVSRDQVLDALIAYGWVDGRRMKLDDLRTMQFLAPRKEQAWAQTYKDRAARLDREGRMQPAGLAAIAQSKASGKWNAMAGVDALEAPQDLIAALTSRQALPWWTAAAPSYKRNILRWIATAKTPKTRLKRIDTLCAHAARGEKVPHY